MNNNYDVLTYGFSDWEGLYFKSMKHTDSADEALNLWFKENEEEPTCIDLLAPSKERAQEILDYFIANYETFKSKYNSVYKWEYLLHEAKNNKLNGFKTYEYVGTEVYPFCKG